MAKEDTVITIESRMAAFIAAQGAMPIVQADHTANVRSKTGSSYSYKFAPLGDIVKACRPAMEKHGIGYTQTPRMEAGILTVETKVLDRFGVIEDLTGSVSLMVSPTAGPQDIGGLLSYARRYSLCATFGIVTTEDDDAAAAQAASQGQDQILKPADPVNHVAESAYNGRQAAMKLADKAKDLKLITGMGKTVDASLFMAAVKTAVPDLFYPEDQQKPGRMVNWAAMTESQEEKIRDEMVKQAAIMSMTPKEPEPDADLDLF